MLYQKKTIIRDTSGRKLTPLRLRRALALNIAVGVSGMFWVAAVMGMPLTMLMEALGASGLLIGAIITVNQLAMVVQVPTALFVEKLARRKLYWGALMILSRSLWFVPALLLWLPAVSTCVRILAILVVACASALLAHASVAPWFSWMTDLVPERQRCRFWSRRQGFCMMSFLAAMALYGMLLDHNTAHPVHGFALVFFLAALLGTLDIVFHLFIPEPRSVTPTAGQPLLRRCLAPFRDRNFLYFTLAMGGWMFAVGLIGPFGLVYLKKTFGLTYMNLTALTIAASLGNIVASFIIAYYMERVGARAFGVIMLLVVPLFTLPWFFVMHGSFHWTLPLLGAVEVPRVTLILFLNGLVAGGFFAGVGITQVNLLSELSPHEGRTMAMAVHWSLTGGMSALGPLLGGWIMDLFAVHPLSLTLPGGMPFSFFHVLLLLHAACCLLLAVPLLLRVRPCSEEMKVASAFGQMILANPLRAFRDMYFVNLADAPVSSSVKANALDRLGLNRSTMAVRDLRDRLYDSAAEVRERAAYALGAIASDEAVEALTNKLNDPQSDLAVHIARALRGVQHPLTTHALVRKLESGLDHETLSETVRTLGCQGDRRVGGSLLRILRETRNDKVIDASSEALARLGEMAAIHEILPHLRRTCNPVLKCSLATAVGDLLGQRDEFYKILTVEQKEPGREIERLLLRLLQRVRRELRRKMSADPDTLPRLIEALQTAFDDENYTACATVIFHLAASLAALSFGVEYHGDPRGFVDELAWRSCHYGMVICFLEALCNVQDQEKPPDLTEITLAIYALVQWERGGKRKAA